MCLVASPLNESEARVDLVLIETNWRENIFLQIKQYLTKRTISWFPKDITLSNLKVWAKSIFSCLPLILNFVWFLRTSTLNGDCKTGWLQITVTWFSTSVSFFVRWQTFWRERQMPHRAGLRASFWVKFPTVRSLTWVKCPGIARGGWAILELTGT